MFLTNHQLLIPYAINEKLREKGLGDGENGDSYGNKRNLEKNDHVSKIEKNQLHLSQNLVRLVVGDNKLKSQLAPKNQEMTKNLILYREKNKLLIENSLVKYVKDMKRNDVECAYHKPV